MSKGFAIALAAALVMVPCTAVMSAAEESQAEAKQGCCDKNKECNKGSKCTACKCTKCENDDCDVTNCSCEGGGDADCKCTKSACNGCDKPEESPTLETFLSRLMSDSKCAGSASANCKEGSCSSGSCDYAGCSKSDCADGQCERGSSCDALTICGSNKRCGCAEESVLRITGSSLFDAASLSTEYIAEQEILPVLWDQAVGAPTGCTSHALQPNERLCVKLAAAPDASQTSIATAYVRPTPASQGAVERCQEAASTGQVTQIQYSINIIEDCEGCLGEYEALRKGASMMFAESKTLLPAMRVMHKHQLIRQLSSPKVICTAGQTAEVEIGSESTADGAKEWEGIRLEVATEEAENGLMVELAMHAKEHKRSFEVRTALLVEPGQTIVLKANATPAPEGEQQSEERPVYIVVTPEIVK